MAPMKRPAAGTDRQCLDDAHTVTHLAHRWHTPRRRIRSLLRSGQLPYIEFQGQVWIPEKAVRNYERFGCGFAEQVQLPD